VIETGGELVGFALLYLLAVVGQTIANDVAELVVTFGGYTLQISHQSLQTVRWLCDLQELRSLFGPDTSRLLNS
jgi:hypothetical protein